MGNTGRFYSGGNNVFYAMDDATVSYTNNGDRSLPDTTLQFTEGWNAVYEKYEFLALAAKNHLHK
jgi:hypothetical protein